MTDATAAAPLTIDVVSDVVCPWCYVGKRRLEAALAARPGESVIVRWRPFQLDPTIPPGGLDRRSYMARKLGGEANVAAAHARLEEAGRAEGIPFAFDRITRAVNTLDAHRVLHWAAAAGRQAATKEALMRAYFVEGRDIADRAELAAIAGAVGLDPEAIGRQLADDTDVDTVRQEIAAAVRIGVSGVPFFIFAEAFAVSGAQSAEMLATALDRARQHLAHPEPAILSA